MRPGEGRAARRAGFTLVEVLLTLLIMGGIMLSMTQILTAARTSRDTIHNIQETQAAGPAIMDLVERDLRGVLVYDRTRQNHLRVRNRVVLGFDADSLDFVTTGDSLSLQEVSERFVRADANEVGYRVRPIPTSDQFLELHRRESFGIDEEPFEGGTFTYLHDRVKGFDIQCFAKDGTDEEPQDEWGTDKSGENIGLPARIEISLTLELAPRIVNEQMRYLPIDKRTVTYKRVIRLPESLRLAEEKLPVPAIPIPPAATASTTTGGPASGGTPAGGTSGTGATQITTGGSGVGHSVPSSGGAGGGAQPPH